MNKTIITISSLLALANLSNAQTVTNQPYSNGSSTDNLLQFNGGADGTVEAPSAPLLVGIGYSNVVNTTTGGGWDLSASGSTTVGLLFIELGSSSAETRTVGSQLEFNTNTTGLSDLVGVSFPMAWEASASVPGSDSWLVGAGDRPVNSGDTVTYNFDLDFNSGLAGLDFNLFPDLSLSITDGSGNNLVSTSGFGNLTNTIFASSGSGSVSFNYDPSNGPLEVTWSSNQLVELGLLNILSGDNNIYTVSNTDFVITSIVDPIPEPSSSLLLGLGGLTLILRRRR